MVRPIICGCECGGTCSKTTMCYVKSVSEDYEARIEELEGMNAAQQRILTRDCERIVEFETRIEDLDEQRAELFTRLVQRDKDWAAALERIEMMEEKS